MEESLSNQRLTMSQIAAAAGVSVPTVSKVINHRSDVAPATRERVERIIMEQGYVTNKTARALRKGRSGLVDLIVHGLDNLYELEIIRGVEDVLEERGFSLVISATHRATLKEATWERYWLNKVINGVTDGVILVLVDNQNMHLRELERREIPFVVVDRLGEIGPDVPSVGATNWVGGRAATSYLASLGHRRIGTIQGPATTACTSERLAGYRTALEEAGIPYDPELVRYGDFGIDSGHARAKELLSLPDPPTAIFAGNDGHALGVYRVAFERNMSIPRDISVIGFDDNFLSMHANPTLTTVRQPLFEMGRVASNMLLRLIVGEPLDSIRVELATPLIRRNSCAPPLSTRAR